MPPLHLGPFLPPKTKGPKETFIVKKFPARVFVRFPKVLKRTDGREEMLLMSAEREADTARKGCLSKLKGTPGVNRRALANGKLDWTAGAK